MAKPKVVEKKYFLIFILLTSLFALWGFANDITNPMVAAFGTVLELPQAEAAMVQFAFYGGYFTMAIPAALFIRKFSYKKGILVGLALYSIGAFMFIPAADSQQFWLFCVSLYVLTFGLAFLETTSNPFVLSLGEKKTATRRLNFAQAFNPMGSLCGMFVAANFVLPNLWSDRRDAAGQIVFNTLSEAEKANIRLHDLDAIRDPYVIIGLIVLIVFFVFLFVKVPKTAYTEDQQKHSLRQNFSNLWHNKTYRYGVVTQFFYIAAQITVWTFIIQYADYLGIPKGTAEFYNIVAMAFFLCGRFIATYLMKYVNTRKLLALFAIGAGVCTLGAIFIVGMAGLYSLIGISIFMSLMFPTIYGIALERVDNQDASLGAAFLVMAIVGGAVMPPLQGWIIDQGVVFGLPAVNASYIIPFICFCVVFTYGFTQYRKDRKQRLAEA